MFRSSHLEPLVKTVQVGSHPSTSASMASAGGWLEGELPPGLAAWLMVSSAPSLYRWTSCSCSSFPSQLVLVKLRRKRDESGSGGGDGGCGGVGGCLGGLGSAGGFGGSGGGGGE